MNTKDITWKTVEEKQEELRGITEEAWRKEEWELATLGERTLRTVEQSKAEAETIETKVKVLKATMEALKTTIEALKRQLELQV